MIICKHNTVIFTTRMCFYYIDFFASGFPKCFFLFHFFHFSLRGETNNNFLHGFDEKCFVCCCVLPTSILWLTKIISCLFIIIVAIEEATINTFHPSTFTHKLSSSQLNIRNIFNISN